MHTSHAENLTGQVIKSYELRTLLGVGSFGAVYLAHHAAVKRDVAVKIILPQYANHPDFIRRFEAEAQLVARVEHPYIVPLYDYWREPDSAYLVMRYLRGGSLRDLISHGPMEIDDVARVLDQVAAALTVAHQLGVVHRDLKPANILLDEQGNAYLADFGIAKDLEVPADATMSGTLVGSPAYLSPEQVRTEPVTPLSDIYSLGIVLYEMLAGEKPFMETGVSALLIKQLHDTLPDVRMKRPELSEDIHKVIQRATAKVPAHRYPNAVTVAAAFRHAVGKLEKRGDIAPQTTTREMRSVGSGLVDPTPSSLPSSLEIDLPEPENPYKGLRAFQESDALDFFGRNVLTDDLINRLNEDHPLSRFLAVVGPSGSGKSSVVKAGLIPALRRGAMPQSSKWFIVEMIPGSHPFEELEAALLRIAINPPASLLSQLTEDELGLYRAVKRVLPDDPEVELLLFIDQFEEIFTLVDDEEVQRKFIAGLIKAVTESRSRLRVIVTLRADFYDRPLLYPDIGNVFRQRTEVVLPLSQHELEEAIAGPAMRVGITLEEGLASDIAISVGEQPGALPLLQYALTELFERREHRQLTYKAYQETGGVSGALARRAEELYTKMTPAQQEATRQLFLRLVTLGEGTEDTRRRVYQKELYALKGSTEAMDHVIREFGKYRLLTFDRDNSNRESTLEVAHEALIRRWERLRDWINDRREELRTQRRLTHSAQEWDAAQRDHSFLASGTRLAQFEEWSKASDLALTAEESAFLSASVQRREEEEAREQERQAKEKALETRARRFLQATAAVLLIGLIASSALGVIAARARDRAEEQRLIAEDNANEARSLALVADARNAAREDLPNLGLALAVQASDIYQPTLPEVERVLSTLAYAPGVRFRWQGHTGSVLDVAVNRERTQAISVSDDMSVILWDLTTGEEVRRLEGHTAPVTAVDFNADGTLAVTADAGANIILWEVATGEEIRRFIGHRERVNSVIFSPDGTQIASAGGLFGANDTATDTTIRLWEVESGEEVRVFTGHVGGVIALTFSPDGRYLVSGAGGGSATAANADRTVRVWDTTLEDDPDTEVDEAEIFRTEAHGGLVRTVAFSPTALQVLSGQYSAATGGILRLWDVESGEEVRRYYGHTDVMSGVAFAPDGTTLISSSWDRSIRLWNTETGVELARYADHDEDILTMAVSADGEYVITGTGVSSGTPLETSVRVWDLRGRAEEKRLTVPQDWLWDVAYSGDYVAGSTGSLFTTDGDNSVYLWDAASGEVRHTLSGHTNAVHTVAFSPDQAWLASGSWDGTVMLWEVESGDLLHTFEHGEQVLSVNFSPDGQTLAAAIGNPRANEANPSQENVVYLWDVESHELLHKLEGHTAAVNQAVFSPDGTQLISASEDRTVRLWDVASGDEIREYNAHSSGVLNAVFAADGQTFLTSGKDGNIFLWALDQDAPVRQFVGHNGQVLGLALSADGSLLLSGGSDITVRLWSVASGEEMRRFTGHTDWITSVAFSPDDQAAVSVSNDLSLRFWRVDRTVQDVIAWVQMQRYLPTLTCAQQARYHLDSTDCAS